MNSSLPRSILLTAHLPAVAWAVFCAWLLLMPSGRLGHHAETAERFEALGHALLIFILAWFVARSFRALELGGAAAGWWGIAASAAYAVALEVGQMWVPGRGFEWLDVATSIVGALAAAEAPGVLEPLRFGRASRR